MLGQGSGLVFGLGSGLGSRPGLGLASGFQSGLGPGPGLGLGPGSSHSPLLVMSVAFRPSGSDGTQIGEEH